MERAGIAAPADWSSIAPMSEILPRNAREITAVPPRALLALLTVQQDFAEV
jgi:hypothetical protein